MVSKQKLKYIASKANALPFPVIQIINIYWTNAFFMNFWKQ